ncbi:hypothetical protein PPL_04415 [Heterostelium album PN500]|uniref:Uncharacterized protein n=1 Tax=Heterostelium pallidum (strain ATCC 26659 / Pp 5 / PN500) TaxID=670386 RepID=D3B7H7_HETP5|nr:hypothetical protein PPL_04415 [Heterostelium album PN500]EFA82720.1 hypothetical protein PPL_04415 [Heterostelium album PN500]|eukprot:XP_020434837.1 hypothetical protein PPL_04415 [Heterostelium album PN500]
MSAGKFIKDFQAWRIEQIKATPGTNVPLDKLTPQSFMKLSTFTNKVDVVKDESDKYFMSVLHNYQSALGLKAMGIESKVVPLPEVMDVVEGNDPNFAKTFFTQYSKLFLLQLIYNQKKDSTFPTKIVGDVVEEEMKVLGSDTYLSQVTMRLYFLALKKLVPAFLPYILNANTFIPKLKEYLQKPESIVSYVSETFQDQATDVDKDGIGNTQPFNDLKSKLDMLDPTFGLSSEILGTYYNTMLAQYASQTLKDTPLTNQIFQNTIQYFIEQIEKDTAHEFYQTVQNIKALYGGNLVTLYQKLAQAYVFVSCTPSRNALEISNDHMFTLDSTAYISKVSASLPPGPERDEKIAKLKNDKAFYKLSNGLMLGCQLFSIGYGIANYEKLGTFQKALLWTGGGLTIIDLSNVVVESTKNTNIFIYMGQKLRAYCVWNKTSSKFAKALVNMKEYVGKGIKFISKYVAPVLILVSVGLSLYDCFESAKAGDWVTFGLSVLEAGVGSALFIVSVFVTTAWAGPACILLSAILLSLSVAKMLVPIIKEFIEDITEGTPQYQFIESVEPIYRYDENYYFALFWKAGYNASPPEIKKLLDQSRKKMKEEDKQSLLYYEAYQQWASKAVPK